MQDLDIASGMFAPTEEEHYKAFMKRYGGYWRYPQMLDFCYLVNPYFPPKRMIDEIKASFETLMREYPSGMYVNSLLAAKNFSVKQDYIVVGNGAAELIKCLMENWAGRLGNIIPTFEEYPNRLDKDHLVQFVPSNDGFNYTADDVMSYFEDKAIDTLLLINPDNPSGNYIPFNDLLRLVEWTKKKNVRFVVDESFVDFASVDGQYSLLDNAILSDNTHLAVVKSISKSYGVPGFRLGVLASGNTELISKMKKQVAIWNINSFGEFYMQIYEKYHKDYIKACESFKEEREIFYNELQEISYLKVYPSQANYFLCRVKEKFTSNELALRLLKHNILIKDCGTKKAFDSGDYIRIAIRDRKDNHCLISILKGFEC
jgi:histidinol-phosphate/aromatic aminotransferase/cobyric acid decarboxylase-like protein